MRKKAQPVSRITGALFPAAAILAVFITAASASNLSSMNQTFNPPRTQAVASLLTAPMQFEENQGQIDPEVRYLARGKGYTLFLTPTESVLVLQQSGFPSRQVFSAGGNLNTLSEPAPIKQSVVRMKLQGSNPTPALKGIEQLPGIVNYFIGNDPAKWRTKIPTYAKVQYNEVYPGIDLAYYGNQGRLEYDFIVAPGVDPSQIKLAFEGTSDIRVARSGDLLLTAEWGEVRLQKPIVYQLDDTGRKTLVAAHYVAAPRTPNAVNIKVAAYDAGKPLIIDPILIYSSYIGGPGIDITTDVAVDASGNAFVAGWGQALSLPTTGTPYDSSFNGSNDVWVLKTSPSGTLLVWTYLGGSGNDNTPRIALDGSGNVWLSGTAGSGGGGFPTTPGSLQPVSGGSSDAFVAKLDPSASVLLYSTFYGGTNADQGRSLAVDASGSIVYLAGITTSVALPGVTGSVVQPAFGGGLQDGFVAKLNIATGQILYATYLGGADRDDLWKVRVDSAGNAHVVGDTRSTNFPGTALSAIPALASFQPTFGGGLQDPFVAKLNSAGTQLIYSTYLGGSGPSEVGRGLALDSAGQAVVSGNSASVNFPIAGTPFQSTSFGGGVDYFVTKFRADGTGLVFSTFIGGNGDDFGSSVALDPADNIYVTGPTNSCRLPANPHPLQINRCGLGAPFNHVPVFKLDPSGSSLLSLFAFTGSSGNSDGIGIVADGVGNVYVVGLTRASDFTTQNPFQPMSAGGPDDGFIAKISDKPVANAGPDQTKNEGNLVTLDGSASTGGASLTYAWTCVGGPCVALTGPDTVSPTFSAPSVTSGGATLTFQLVVCAGSTCSDPDIVNVHITNINQSPVAEAGPDQTVQESSSVILDGTGSYDPDIETIAYQWTQTGGPPVALSGGNTANPTFTAPSVGSTGATLIFHLTVTDPHLAAHSDTVAVFVTNMNQVPVSNAGSDQTKNENTLVTLDGTVSHDPDLDALSYQWSQVSGPGVVLTGGNTVSPTFTAPDVGAGGATLVFQLIVNDGHVNSAADQVAILVQNVNDPPVCTMAQANPASLWPPNHTMVPVSITGITDPDNHAVTITFTAVRQDEPINGLGDGDTSPDAAVSGQQVLLRAERSGTGDGRVYQVTFKADDGQGGMCTGTVKVSVPHNKKDSAIDGGPTFNSFGP